jgi:methionine-rich copper-binding protein CopC
VRTWIAAVLFAATALAVAPPAGAGVALQRTEPAAGAVVRTPPRDMHLLFDGPVEPAGSGTDVFFAGHSVAAGKPRLAGGNPREVVLPLRSRLASGPYAVRWSVRDVRGGGIVSGAFIFAVRSGLPAAASAATPPGANGSSGWSSAGRWLLVAGLVLAVALVAYPALARRRRPNTAAVAGALGIAALGAALWLVLRPTGGAATMAAPAQAIVYAGQDDRLAVGLEVSPKGDKEVGLKATVLGFGGPVSRLGVRFGIDGARSASTACGKGVYCATVPIDGRPRQIDVRLPGRTLRFAGPSEWPARDGLEIVRRAEQTINGLQTLVVRSHLASDSRHEVTTVYTMVAPNRLAYENDTGSGSVIIGSRRWDRSTRGGRWVASQQVPAIRQPAPFWPENVTNASVLRTERVAGRPAWVVSFVDPATPSWFTAWIDRRTYRTVRLDMVAVAHFMHDRDGPFNAAVSVEPPGA